MKKLLIGGVIILVLVGGVAGYMVLSTEKKIATDSLSDRAKEYIEDQKGGNDSLWRSVDLENSKANLPKSTLIAKEGCFSLTLPFRMKAERPEEGCSVDITTDEPMGLFVASLKEMSVSSLDDIPSVRLRREKTEEYTEETWNANGKAFLTFKSKDGTYKRNIFYVTPKGIFSMTLNINTNEDLDPKMKEALETLRFE